RGLAFCLILPARAFHAGVGAPSLQVGGGQAGVPAAVLLGGVPFVPGGLAADGGAAQVLVVPGVFRVGVGGVPAAQGLVGGVGVDGAGLAHRAGVLGVVVDDDAGADVTVVIDPLDVVDH